MKKPNITSAIVLFILFGLLIPAVMLWAIDHGLDLSREYQEDGRKVTCTVTEVVTIGKTQSVTVKYKSEDGEWVEAYCTANGRVSAGQTLEGYVLPDEPYKVYCPPDIALKILIYVITGGIALGGWAALLSALKEQRQYSILFKNGMPCQAQLTSWHRQQGGIEAQFRVFRKNGEEKIINITARGGTPVVGEYYDIMLAEDSRGKLTAALRDERLR